MSKPTDAEVAIATAKLGTVALAVIHDEKEEESSEGETDSEEDSDEKDKKATLLQRIVSE